MAGNLTAMIASIFSGSAVTPDPYFEYTTLLLPGNGTNGAQNNTFLDASTNNFTITRNGNTTQGTFSPFSQTGWGNYFDGNGDYLTVASNAAFQLGTGDFSIEAWIYPTTTPGGQYPVVIRLESGGYNSNGLTLFWRRYNVNPNGVSVDCGGVVSLAGTSTVALNTWTHVAVTRTGTTFALFVNGTREATTTSSNNFSVNDSVYIGDGTSDTEFPGYISNVRIVKGSNVYGVGTTLTVPTEPLTAISGTSLLTCQSNRFKDNSTNNFTVTPSGNTSVVAFSPFNPTASWSAATYGGSGYFDGNGDYLTLSANSAFAIGTGDFTFDCWLYPLASNSGLFTMTTSGVNDLVITNNQNPQSGGTTSNTANVQFGATSIIGPANAVVQNAWNHIAVVRSSGSVRVYVNGNGGTQTTNTSNVTGSYAPAIGALYTHAASATPACYMSNMRLIKGTAVYSPASSTITVPTAPVTAITNTSLLLNFTNAGIYDATSKNDLETVGNAQISTAQSKWGGSSMYFDGNEDGLIFKTTETLLFNTGDFTIECWVNFSSVGQSQLIVGDTDFATGNGTWGLLFNSPLSKLRFVVNNAVLIIDASWSPSTSTWYHIAVARNGSSVRVFINGTQLGSTVTSSANIDNTYGSGRTYVGRQSNDATAFGWMYGYLQDLRITKGYARYTSNFTPPTAAFPTL